MRRGEYEGARIRRVILSEYADWRRYRAEGRAMLATDGDSWTDKFNRLTGRTRISQAEAAISALNAVRHALFDRRR